MPEFRSGIYSLVPDEVLNEGGEEEPTTSSQSPAVDPVQKENLVGMGFPEAAVIAALVKFPKPEQDVERIEWILSGAVDVAAVSSPSSKKIKRVKKRKLAKLALELQNLFALLQNSERRAVSTEDLTKSFGWLGSQTREQHDVHELNRVLFDAIEQALKNTSGKGLIQSLYNGIQVNKTICSQCNTVSERVESFQDIGVPLFHHQDVLDSLASITSFESLHGQNQYFCETCNKKVDARRGASFRKLPDILILCLGRFEYDMKTGTRIKNTREFQFPLVLDMSPYCEESLQDQPEIPTEPRKSKELFVGQAGPDSKHVYDLCNVIIHVGSNAGFGHYHAYARDIAQEGIPQPQDEDTKKPKNDIPTPKVHNSQFGNWFDFNDSSVYSIPVEKVASQYGGSGECAYMLVYRSRRLIWPNSSKFELPERVFGLIETHNKEMEIARQKQREQEFKFTLMIVSDTHYEIGADGRLHVQKQAPEPTTAIDSAPDPSQTNDADSVAFFALFEEPNRSVSGIERGTVATIQVDKRDKIADLWKKIKQKFQHTPDLQQLELSAIEESDETVRSIKPLFSSKSLLDGGDELILNLTLDDLGFKPGLRVLVWDGIHINRKQFTDGHYKVTLNVLHYKTKKPTPITVELPESSSLSQLKGVLHSVTGIPPEHQFVCRIQYRQAVPLLQDDDPLSIYELRLTEPNSSLSVENRSVDGESPFRSRVIEDLQERAKFVEVRVLNKCQNAEPKLEESILMEVEKEASIAELKLLVLGKFNLDHASPNEFALRRCSAGIPGAVCANEKITLAKMQIGEGAEIILERKDAPAAPPLELRAIIGIPSRIHIGSLTLIVTEEHTVLRVKEEIGKLIDMSPSEFRLRLTELSSKPHKLMDDERRTLRAYNLRQDGGCVFVEEGPPPMKGQIFLSLDQYQLIRGSESSPEAIPSEIPATPISTEPPMDPVTPSTPSSDSKIPTRKPVVNPRVGIYSPLLHLSSFSTVKGKHDFKLVPLGFKLEVSSLHKLEHVKKLMHSKYFPELPSPQHIRLWHNSRILKQDELALKRQQIHEDTTITVQLLPHEDEVTKNDANKCLIYLHRRKKDHSGFDEPIEFFFEGYTAAELVKVLSDQSGIPPEYLLVARFALHHGIWELVHDGTCMPAKAVSNGNPTNNTNTTQATTNPVPNTPTETQNETTNLAPSETATPNKPTSPTETNAIPTEPAQTTDAVKGETSKQPTQSKPTHIKAQRQPRRALRKRAGGLVDGVLIAIADARDDPNHEFSFVQDPDEIGGYRRNEYGPAAWQTRGTTSERWRETGLKINIEDEEFEYEELEYDTDEEDGEQV